MLMGFYKAKSIANWIFGINGPTPFFVIALRLITNYINIILKFCKAGFINRLDNLDFFIKFSKILILRKKNIQYFHIIAVVL